MKTLSHFLLLLLLLPACALAQDYKRTLNWYFGDSAGISFATNPPTALSNGAMFSYEGCASISDTNGNILFYTNGEKIWNKNHQIMELGDIIFGNNSSTQAAIIIPQPGNDSIYYLFTTPAIGNTSSGLRMTIVNIRANGGLGKVILRNTKLQSSMCEKLTATLHENGRDIWIVVHGFKDSGKDNLFYSYLLTENGLVNCPILTNIGAEHYKYAQSLNNAQGAMKFSPDGKRLAVTVYNQWQNYIEFFDFDKTTGILSEMRRIKVSGYLPYGLEFSKNGKKVYVTTRGNDIYQYNLDVYDSLSVQQSETLIYPRPNSIYNYHAQIQLGADNRIYIALVDSNFLSIIEHPDSAGLACGFQLNGLQLASGKTSQYGLPNFVTSYLNRDSSIDFTYRFLCPSTQAVFNAKFALSPQWSIRKKNSVSGWSYSGNNFTHTFDTGTFDVWLRSGTDSIKKTITVSPTAELLIPTDTLKCQVDTILLNPNNAHWYTCITWNNSFVPSETFAALQTGTYTVTAWTTHGCKLFDTINVRLYKTPPDPLVNPMADTLYFCKEKSVVLSPDSGSSFIWNDGLTHAQRTVDTTGLFYTHWIDSFTCVRNDTVSLLHFSYAYSHKLTDTIRFCRGASVILKSDSGSNFIWNDGQLNATRKIDTTGLFNSHWIDSNTCAQSDTTRLLFYPVTSLQKPLPDSITFCIGKSITLNPDSGSNFIWNDGITTAKRVVNSAGVFFTFWNDINGCHMADTLLVKTYNIAKPTIQRTGDSLFASGNFSQWQWLLNNQPVNGAIQNRHNATQNGWYKVWASDTGLCVAVSDSVNITNVGINNIALNNSIQIYPNPATHTLQVEATDDKLSSVMLINGTGQTVFLTLNNESTININCTLFPKGIYFIQLTTTKHKTFQQKIIIQ